ncbi:right-handed parallel beta-helix repeat-containing protein [Candidatus Neomarinimicrobiota bacterium]
MRSISLFLTIVVSLHSAEYFVATNGSDENPGTIDLPFLTIQKAADRMEPGDVCIIRNGIYKEIVRPQLSGTLSQPIRFEAYPGETVTITGTVTVPPTAWQPFEGSVYRADVSQFGDVTQVFADWERMGMARFPSNTNDDPFTPTWGHIESAVTREQPDLSEITDPLLGSAGINLTGGDLWLLSGRRWVSFGTTVESHIGNTISFAFPGNDTDGIYGPAQGGIYFVTGLLGCLDHEKEWYYDAAEKMLYFYPPGGIDPSLLDVEVRVREWGFDASALDYIQVKDINFFATAVNFYDSQDCLLDGSRIYYPVPYGDVADGWFVTMFPENATYRASIRIGGEGNVIRNCEVAHSWAEGIVVTGRGNTVENCLVHDINWICTDAAPIRTSGSDHVIVNNTIYDAARGGIVHRWSKNLEIAYNNIYRVGLLNTDLGGTYCYETDGEGTEIHHNWIHDIWADWAACGIYIDNSSSNFILHHNVIWNTIVGIATNFPTINNGIYNNTVWNCIETLTGWGDWVPVDLLPVDQKVYNNLTNSTAWRGNDVRQNIQLNDARFVDSAGGDYRLQADSPAREDYLVEAELMNGGFENGTIAWSSGSELTSVSEPVHSGSRAVLAHDREWDWQDVTQDITAVLKDHGPGEYTIEAWMLPSAGETVGILRFMLVDDDGRDWTWPNTEVNCTAGTWTKLIHTSNLSWTGDLQGAWFQLMTSDQDQNLEDYYVDDCVLLTPEAVGTGQPKGGILIPGITDDVTDGKPDAGAYEYGGTQANWVAGSTLTPRNWWEVVLSVDDRKEHPIRFSLAQNYPNPFNPITTVHYNLPKETHIKITIYDMLGRNVHELISKKLPSGKYSVQWNGKDINGNPVSTGIYLYQLKAGNFVQTKKMVLMK